MSGELKAPRSTGDAMTPENATPRSGPGGRSGVISGAPLQPEGARPRATGDAMGNTLPNEQVPAVVTRAPQSEPRISRIPK